MFPCASFVFGLTLAECAVLAAGASYMISVARDWRPIRTIRSENRELRGLVETLETRNAELEGQVATLQQATDLTILQSEHRQFAETMERVTLALDSLDGAVRANTAVLEVIGRGSEIARALEGT